MTDPATSCTSDIETKLGAISGTPLGDKILTVISQEALADRSKMLKTPFAGVMFGGLQSRDQADPSRQGLAADCVVVIVFGFAAGGHTTVATDAFALMSKARGAMLQTKSPTGHPWRFRSEMYAGEHGAIAIYLQTWATFAPLT